MKFLAC